MISCRAKCYSSKVKNRFTFYQTYFINANELDATRKNVVHFLCWWTTPSLSSWGSFKYSLLRSYLIFRRLKLCAPRCSVAVRCSGLCKSTGKHYARLSWLSISIKWLKQWQKREFNGVSMRHVTFIFSSRQNIDEKYCYYWQFKANGKCSTRKSDIDSKESKRNATKRALESKWHTITAIVANKSTNKKWKMPAHTHSEMTKRARTRNEKFRSNAFQSRAEMNVNTFHFRSCTQPHSLIQIVIGVHPVPCIHRMHLAATMCIHIKCRWLNENHRISNFQLLFMNPAYALNNNCMAAESSKMSANNTQWLSSWLRPLLLLNCSRRTPTHYAAAPQEELCGKTA